MAPESNPLLKKITVRKNCFLSNYNYHVYQNCTWSLYFFLSITQNLEVRPSHTLVKKKKMSKRLRYKILKMFWLVSKLTKNQYVKLYFVINLTCLEIVDTHTKLKAFTNSQPFKIIKIDVGGNPFVSMDTWYFKIKVTC